MIVTNIPADDTVADVVDVRDTEAATEMFMMQFGDQAAPRYSKPSKLYGRFKHLHAEARWYGEQS